MRIKIRTNRLWLFLPVPTALIGFAAKCVPESAFEELRAKTPEPYAQLITKDNVRMLLGECLDIFRDNKGLEVVHVEVSDGTYVSIKL